MTYGFLIRLTVVIAGCEVPDGRDFELAASFGIIILPVIVSQVSE